MPAKFVPEFLETLIERARVADGQPPFSDQSLVNLRTGVSELLAFDDIEVAIITTSADSGVTEAELVVDPAERGSGRGTALLEHIIAGTRGDLRVWAHGDHPAAQTLAARHGFVAERRLLQLRTAVPSGSTFSADTYRAGDDTRAGDDAEWLRINSLAFAFHAEQGSVSQQDLDELKKEPWFTPEDFLVLREGDSLIGYCWLKIDDGIGEFYVVGVDPAHQREGLGRRLMDSGFARLEARGIHTAALYVEADNVAAVALYHSLGFTQHSIDVQYSLKRTT